MATVAEPQREKSRRGSPVPPAPDAGQARGPRPEDAVVNLDVPISTRTVAVLQRQVGNRAASRLLSRPPGQQASGRAGDVAGRSPASAAAAEISAGGVRQCEGTATGGAVPEAFLQRAVACPAPPVAPEPVAPGDDPRFVEVAGTVEQIGASQRAHPPASTKAAEAQAAAVPPANEAAAQAGASQVGKMNQAEAGSFDKVAFIAAVAKAIDAASPKNLDDADKLKDSGKAAEVKDQVSGLVAKGTDDSAQDIKSATQAAPDASAANPKPVTPMTPEEAGQPPAPPAADGAVPAPRGPEQTNLDYGPCGVDAKLADAKVTDQQLAKGNEPQFTQALDSKQKLQQYAAAAPGQVQAGEAQQLAATQGGAAGSVTVGVAGMHATRGSALSGVGGHKDAAKAADEAKRAEISKHIEDVFAATKTDVTAMLEGLDQQVGKAFDDGEKTARETFNQTVGQEMDDWKDKRYSGITGAAQWVADKLAGAPPEVDQIFARNRAKYLADMQQVISTVADIVGATLTKAKQRIADGQAQVKAYVASQPASLRQFAAEAGGKIAGQFASLENDVTDKQNAIVSDLAQKYVEARKSVDDAITKMQEENKGYVQEAESAVEGAIETIEKLRDWIEHAAQRIANSVDRILEDPISFIGKLLNAVKTGFGNFMSNIVEHLEQGFKEFLFGTLAEAGIQLPETFDLKGIFQLVLNIFGITYEHIKARILAKLGPKAPRIWHLIEQGIAIIKTIAEKGLSGVWDMLMEKIQGIKDIVVDGIKSFVIETVVKKGIEWLLSLFNPAGAFVEAVELIIDVVEFFIQKGKQIQETVDRILDSVESLLSGGEGGVPALIEQTLAKAVPTVITFLADLVGLGDISTTIQNLVKKAQSVTDEAIDWLVDKAIGLVKAAWATLTGKDEDKDKDTGKDTGKDKDKASQVENQAMDQLIGAEDSLTDMSSAQQKAAEIQGSLEPQGLRSMELVEKNESQFDVMIVVQTAKKGEGVWQGKKNAAVTADATVHFKEAADISQYKFGSSYAHDEEGNVIYNEDGSPRLLKQPATIQSGMIRPPESGSTSLGVMTWSGEKLASWADARSHAERNFVDWAVGHHVRTQPIDGIDLKITGHWPCKNCASSLEWLGDLIVGKNEAAKLTITVGESATNWENEWSSPEECEGALSPWKVVSGLTKTHPVEIAKTL
jgi:hypothetical protein